MVFTLAYERIKMKYVWMTEADSVFSKEGSLVEVPYIEPSFLEVLMLCQWFKGLMPYGQTIWNILCSNKQYVMWFVQYVTCDDACYSHIMTFLIRFWQVHWLDIPYFISLKEKSS